jgi:glycosyltransferase involved in cell wall biosynthesis
MKVAFFHDAPLIRANDGVVYSLGFTYDIWERYLSVFDSLVVSTRMTECNEPETFNRLGLSSGPGVVFSPVTSYSTRYAPVFNKRAIAGEIRSVLSRVDCAIVRLPSSIGRIACEEAIKMDKPYLVELVGCPWDSLRHHSWQGKMVAPFAYYGTKKIVEDAEYVVYVTSEFLQERYPTKGKWIACSDVALEESDDKILEARISKIKNKPKSEPIIVGTIGAVDIKYKGQQNVIKALARLKEQGLHNFQYQLVGDGDQSYLRSVAQKFGVAEQVKFLGKMSHQEVFKWLDSIDVYIQPSKTEGLPRSLIEAMSRGLPCFGSRAGGIPELLDDDYLFSNTRTNADEIAELLEGLTKDCMEEQAWRNFMQSRSYEKRFLDAKRQRFFREFQQSVGTRMGS